MTTKTKNGKVESTELDDLKLAKMLEESKDRRQKACDAAFKQLLEDHGCEWDVIVVESLGTGRKNVQLQFIAK